jgi:magnesium transporter
LSKFTKKRSRKSGLAPGTLVHIGEQKVSKAKITIIDYNDANCEIKSPASCEECYPYKDKPSVTWINIDGLHELPVIEKIGAHFGLHPLLLEDLVNTEQRPKLEDYDSYFFIVLKMLSLNPQNSEINSEQISLILGSNFVLSFQETEGDIFDPIRDRIKNNKGRIRKMGADFLAYSLMDAIVDNYFIILEKLGERVELLEDELVQKPTQSTLHEIHKLKREMIFLRRSVWPLREVLASLERDESPLLTPQVSPFFRDVYDHTIQVIDTIETLRDMLSGMIDIYLSSISNRMNAVMKVLTVIATIFMPLTFLVGVYGMNFKFIPLAEWSYGFYSIWAASLVIALAMLIYFKRRRWL